MNLTSTTVESIANQTINECLGEESELIQNYKPGPKTDKQKIQEFNDMKSKYYNPFEHN
jgi:hypothetical protein